MTDKQQHTPGPKWTISNRLAKKIPYAIHDENYNHVCTVALRDDDLELALIIRAAPETAAERDRLKFTNGELSETIAICGADIEKLESEIDSLKSENAELVEALNVALHFTPQNEQWTDKAKTVLAKHDKMWRA